MAIPFARTAPLQRRGVEPVDVPLKGCLVADFTVRKVELEVPRRKPVIRPGQELRDLGAPLLGDPKRADRVEKDQVMLLDHLCVELPAAEDAGQLAEQHGSAPDIGERPAVLAEKSPEVGEQRACNGVA